MIRSIIYFFTILFLIQTTFAVINHNQEYQVVLVDSEWNSASERNVMMNNFLDIAVSDIGIPLSNFSHTVSLRREYSYDIDNCNPPSGTLLRRRDWYSGDNTGQESIDAKIAPTDMTKSQATNAPAEPSATYLAQSVQDIEEDVHYCLGSDWSRTTKVFFSPSDTVPTISKCQDVRSIFPDLVSNNNDNENVQESGGNSVTYYVEYNYQYPNGERLRMQFDLQYPDTTSAQNGNNFNGGEFSFTPTGANGADVSSSLENKVTKAYRQIIDTYGSPGEDDCNYSSNGGSSGSSRSSGGNSSVGSFIVPNIILLLSLIVVFGF